MPEFGSTSHKYSEKLQVVKNAQKRPGQFSWHNENCDIQMVGTNGCQLDYPTRSIWCVTHGQWANEIPVRITWEFADGTKITKEIKHNAN